MKSLLTFVVITAFFCSCESKNGLTPDQKKQKELDSLESEYRIREETDKFMTSLQWDTVGVSESGILVTKARFIEDRYRTLVSLTYKNVSGKKIKAIRFKWYGVDAFGDPVDCGSITDIGFGGGMDDDDLGVGRSTTSQWLILSNGGEEIIKAWPCEIAFGDGTKWKSTWSR